MTPPGLPLPAHTKQFVAPGTWRSIEFASDLHLGDDTPRTFEAFAAYLRCTQADAVFLLGDLFEVWVGDDARHEGFEARLTALLKEAAEQRTVGFMVGNRDFLVGDEFLTDCGVVPLADPTVLVAFGRRVLLTHGDALCLGDTSYQSFRTMVRSAAWQQAFLARPLAERRRIAGEIREESRRLKLGQARSDWVDLDAGATLAWMREAETPDLIHGHTHAPGTENLGPGLVRHVLSDWDLDTTDSAARAEILRIDASGFSRKPPDAC